MKILFVSQSPPYPIYADGATLRVFHLLKEFSHHAECMLICFGSEVLEEHQRASIDELCRTTIVPLNGTSTVFSQVRKCFSISRFKCSKFSAEIKKAMEDFNPDVVFFEQTFMAQYGSLVVGKPVIISAVDALGAATFRQAMSHKKFFRRLPVMLVACQRTLFEFLFLRKFHNITVVGPADAESLSKLIGRRVHVFPNGVDVEYFSPIEDSSHKTLILFTGNLSARMNEEAAIYLAETLFPQLIAEFPTFRFVIAGRKATDSLSARKDGRVEIFCDLDDLRGLLRQALLYICPVVSGAGIKNTVLQAMACRVPVLVTPSVAKPIGIRDGINGFVCDTGEEMLTYAKSLLANPDILRKVGIEGREYVVRHYTWRAVAYRYIKFFRKLIGDLH